MTDTPLFITEHTPAFWRVTFNNPPLNLVGSEMLLALHDAIERMDASDKLRVVVFDSAVEDYFLDHYHLGEKDRKPLPTYQSGLTALPDFSIRVERAPYITIAAIRGRTRAVGSEIALALDLRFGSRERAIFSQPEVGLGVIPGGGALERLPNLTGRSRALEVVVSADDYGADIAERYGWINRAVPDTELDGVVNTLAERIASFDRHALSTAKSFINRRVGLPTPEQLKETQAAFFDALSRPAAQQRAAEAFGRGLETPGAFERDLGRHIRELQLDPSR